MSVCIWLWTPPLSPSLFVCVTLLAICTVAVALTRKRLRTWRNLPFIADATHTLFLSYKSEDAQLVRFVAEQLVAQGQDVWFNEYRVPLHNWDDDFEPELRKGTRSCERAVFFTNARWSSSAWCTQVEAGDILHRVPVDSCIEVRMPFESGPHQQLPELAALPHIDATGKAKWEILAELSGRLGCNPPQSPLLAATARPLMGRINMIPYALDIGGWSASGKSRMWGENLVLPTLRRTEGGIHLSVNIIVGKRGQERQEIGASDNRKVFENLRALARTYFDHTSLAGECVGIHLIHSAGLSHGAFTYWGRSAWCRKYAIVLPAMDGGVDLEFVFTCSVHGSFGQFCRCAWLFDDLVTSLKYGGVER